MSIDTLAYWRDSEMNLPREREAYDMDQFVSSLFMDSDYRLEDLLLLIRNHPSIVDGRRMFLVSAAKQVSLAIVSDEIREKIAGLIDQIKRNPFGTVKELIRILKRTTETAVLAERVLGDTTSKIILDAVKKTAILNGVKFDLSGPEELSRLPSAEEVDEDVKILMRRADNVRGSTEIQRRPSIVDSYDEGTVRVRALGEDSRMDLNVDQSSDEHFLPPAEVKSPRSNMKIMIGYECEDDPEETPTVRVGSGREVDEDGAATVKAGITEGEKDEEASTVGMVSEGGDTAYHVSFQRPVSTSSGLFNETRRHISRVFA